MAKAVIFDMDDVVLDSSAAHGKAWDTVLERYGVSQSMMKKEEISGVFGMRQKEICEFFVEYFKLDADPKALDAERHRIFMGIMSEEARPSEGLLQLLDMLKSKGMKTALATSAVNEYAGLILDKFGIRGKFDAVVTGDDVKNGKPDPEAFLKAAEKLGVEPGECIVIEDAEKGVQAAKVAGMKAIGYQNLSHPYVQDLSKADLVVKSLTEITENVIDSL